MVSVVKYYVIEMFLQVVDKVVQVVGGMGYVKDVFFECFYCDQCLLCIYEGISEIQKVIIVVELFRC